MRKLENPEYKTPEWRRKQSKISYTKNREKYINEWAYNEKRNNRVKHWIARVKGRAKELGLEYNLTDEDFTIPKTCPLLNIPLFFPEHGRCSNTPSMDRKDNSKGYIKGNVHVVSYRANAIKNNASIYELELLLENLKKLE